MASVVFVRFAIEAIHPSLRKKIVSIYSNNSPTVSWVQRQASGQSRVAAQLLRALALRMKLARSSPITATHIAGKDNVFADIPSRSFGSNTNWHCISDSDFLHFYNGTFPLPQQNFWTLYRHISKICTSFFSVLRMKPFAMIKWRASRNVHRSAWERYLQPVGLDPYLQTVNDTIRARLLTGFAACI